MTYMSHARTNVLGIGNMKLQQMNRSFQQYLRITGTCSLFASWCTSSCLDKHPRNWLCLYGYPMEVFSDPLVSVPNSSPHPTLLSSVFVWFVCAAPACVLGVLSASSPVLHEGFTGCYHRLLPDGTMSLHPAVPTPTSAINISRSDRERWYLFKCAKYGSKWLHTFSVPTLDVGSIIAESKWKWIIFLKTIQGQIVIGTRVNRNIMVISLFIGHVPDVFALLYIKLFKQYHDIGVSF